MRKTETCNRQLRGLLERRESILLPGAANALTARVIEDLGFKAIYVTGAGVTNTFLGFPFEIGRDGVDQNSAAAPNSAAATGASKATETTARPSSTPTHRRSRR